MLQMQQKQLEIDQLNREHRLTLAQIEEDREQEKHRLELEKLQLSSKLRQ